MPTPLIKKLAKEGKGTIKELEKKWKQAKAIAHNEGHEEDWAYITAIFKKMINEGEEMNREKPSFKQFYESLDRDDTLIQFRLATMTRREQQELAREVREIQRGKTSEFGPHLSSIASRFKELTGEELEVGSPIWDVLVNNLKDRRLKVESLSFDIGQ